MHRMKRSGAALLAVLMLGLAPAGAARASLGLPEGLAVIGEEAFRNSGIGGTVTVEEGVTALGENALSGTGVCALTLPASLTELGDQQLDGLVYLRVNGSGTQIGLASCAPRCVMAPAGSPAESYAAAHSIPFVPLDALHTADGFYYAENGAGLTLLCAVNPDGTGTEAVIPKTVDGLYVTEVSAFAFAGCGTLTAVTLPEAARASVTAETTADCPSAVVSYAGTAYRALLISESTFYRFEDGSPYDGRIETIGRNAGDVSNMSAMLQSVTGPEFGRYSITTADDVLQDEIHSLINSSFAGADEDDVSLFFIATHGDVYGDAGDYYAGALEVTSTDYDSWLLAELYLSDLAGWLAAVPGKVIVIIESCGSGAAVYSTEPGFAENSRDVRGAFSPARFDRQVIDAFADADPGITVTVRDGEGARVGEFRQNKFYVLTAARFRELSWGTEGSRPHNYFTQWLIQGVGASGAMPADTDASGTVTLNELFLYIKPISDNYNFGSTDNPVYQHVQVYPSNCGYELFRR